MDKIIVFLKKIPKIFRNKYVITLVIFIFWILFIDDYNIVNQYKLHQKVKKLEEQKSYYINEIKKDSTQKYNLENIEGQKQSKVSKNSPRGSYTYGVIVPQNTGNTSCNTSNKEIENHILPTQFLF